MLYKMLEKKIQEYHDRRSKRLKLIGDKMTEYQARMFTMNKAERKNFLEGMYRDLARIQAEIVSEIVPLMKK